MQLKSLKSAVKVSIIIAVIIITNSCGRSNKDYSLTPEGYHKLGMPEYNKKWNADDYSEANITMGSLIMNNPLSLPREGSGKSGKVFERIISVENLSFVYDTAIPLKVRAYLIQHYPGTIGEVEYFYSYEDKGKPVYSKELASVKRFELQIHDMMLELGLIIDKSDDETLAGFKSGLKMVKHNYMKLVMRLLEDLEKVKIYPAATRNNLSDAIATSIKNNSSWMTDEDRNQLESTITGIIKRTDAVTIRKKLEECLDSL